VGRLLPVLPSDNAVVGPATERKDAARNRQKILAAARALMERGGLDGVCMDELARAAGVGKGTLYRRFADKHALFRALLDDDERHLQEAVRVRFGLDKTATPTVRLLTLWSALVDFVFDHRDVLAAAERESRSRVALLDSAPYHWRHVELARGLVRCGVDATQAERVAAAWVQMLAAEVVRAACAGPHGGSDVAGVAHDAHVDDVRATWRALPLGLAAFSAESSTSA